MEVRDLREGAEDARRTADDSPFGGGAGMVLMPEPLFRAVEQAPHAPRPLFLLAPGGRRFDQSVAEELAALPGGFSLLCGRYEGVDQRVSDHLVDGELSVGDFVLAGGELAALVVIEAVARGFRLPETLEAWAQFDYVAGDPGPWVSPEKFELIERFKFFHELAWKRVSRGKRLVQKLARYRCDKDNYRWPVEMLFTRWLVPAQTLS